ncbi:MAG: riboflavin synthase [Chthonomonas sp.]|nr:riboflavin synthase [Chthonomonas sp.]
MFTGLVQAVGTVKETRPGKLILSPIDLGDEPVQLGESIAINGCCLTVIEFEPGMTFELSPETYTRTNFGDVVPGSGVNLERALRVGDRLGGHIVQGHVDAIGRILDIQERGEHTVYRFEAPDARYLIDKGSVTVDGISLTVVHPTDAHFEAWVIPHTRQHTNLMDRKVGDRVNLEYDVLAKHVERLINFRING